MNTSPKSSVTPIRHPIKACRHTHPMTMTPVDMRKVIAKATSRTENSSEEEIDPWITLIEDAASKIRAQYDDILQSFLMKSYGVSEAEKNL